MTMILALAACDQAASPERDELRRNSAARAEKAVLAPARPPAYAPAPLIGEHVARTEWAKATDKAGCAPLALASDAGGGGTPRRADFSGGWGVAFDRPGLRSAYGFAGPGILPGDAGSAESQRARLARQWPLMKEITTLPPPSFAGYGLSGAEPYPLDNPEGYGQQSVAYLRVGGQTCTYNIWSRIGRAHLESLLDNLRLLH
jgi:hypothetical protein